MDPAAVTRIQGTLLQWFAGHRRDLPLRHDRSPYRVLVAEVMSLQTRAEAVGPWLQRLTARFPDVAALAGADEQEVLALWQGLGYYSRARNLHRAARLIVERHGGVVPSDPAVLRSLPGVGPYVAGAVASFAFGHDAVAFDANAARVLARLCNVERATEELARNFLPPGRATDWNEAVMDLGALICVPRNPRCAICPLLPACAGHRAGRAAQLPSRAPKPPKPEVSVTTLVIRDSAGRLGLIQRPPRGLLAGMWEFPGIEEASSPEAVARRHGLHLDTPPQPLPSLRHVFTHRAWNVKPYGVVGSGPLRWVALADLADVPLAGPTAKLAAGARSAPPK